MAKSNHYRIRKIHRYLGVFLGIQFFLWTIGGLYFSWTNIDNVHGDFEKKMPGLLEAKSDLISPSVVIDQLKKDKGINYIRSLKAVNILGNPFYQFIYQVPGHQHHFAVQLADAVTGAFRGPISEAEARELAINHFNGAEPILKVDYLTEAGKHHEYREQPLPAYAVRFNNPKKTTVYVAAELGVVDKFRNQPWRIFDFLWMMHTMDYQGRDNFNNILLRVFSIFGLLTIISGFLLFFYSSRTVRKLKKV